MGRMKEEARALLGRRAVDSKSGNGHGKSAGKGGVEGEKRADEAGVVS